MSQSIAWKRESNEKDWESQDVYLSGHSVDDHPLREVALWAATAGGHPADGHSATLRATVGGHIWSATLDVVILWHVVPLELVPLKHVFTCLIPKFIPIESIHKLYWFTLPKLNKDNPNQARGWRNLDLIIFQCKQNQKLSFWWLISNGQTD